MDYRMVPQLSALNLTRGSNALETSIAKRNFPNAKQMETKIWKTIIVPTYDTNRWKPAHVTT